MNFSQKAELKDIKEEDLKQILEWRNKESIRKVMYNSNIILMDQHIQWYERLQKSETAISKIFYYDHVPYGVLNINQIDVINNKCEWGFFIGANNAPRGMGTILGFTSLNYIFEELSIRKLSAEVLGMNEKSVAFHQKLGFFQEGVLRKHIVKDGSYHDVLIYGIFKEEWLEHTVYIQSIIEGRYL
ncbi:UDP-4-amino-4,6-dideoxy-N-acetyl-beta-L-altrosamine N-acetyltransferase [Peribacillus cavernae]|uniref:UDP-4-amino-4, 6-dideoxy-N-acetyl-beta-L-altrosamine N-acetyltransferase n=1 Tax=Peribacillus cavernae TaxID=1674310 RepID=A0A3S0UAB1_9BACI|nr:UDP-4-amino-4,6-dideoxy-N-acetyl-beta-L-altrosamine N-acetyltransferase [Peribacillus cavernae]MDQ0221216.1 UDP-4-amino-4,6-dideoxy-N-acetyl-beta-L-altrosamine N-acetyltransferase [Peribacillus cavernae]RUQ26567.1 UDP-4-amino-4,6-dideoxy-N-acetyl-beta-L-altrosamine N-acetyltransferase [Peribacillus cavernae]